MIRLFRVSFPIAVLTLLASEIALTTLCFVLAAYWYFDVGLPTYYVYDGGLIRTGLVVMSIIVGMYFTDLYTRLHVQSRLRLLQDLSQVIGFALLAQGVISYANPNLRVGRHIMLVGTVLSFFAIFSWRIFYAKYILDAVTRERFLFVGLNPVVEEMTRHIVSHPELGLSIAGYVVDGVEPGTELTGGQVMGPILDLRKVAAETSPTRIVVGMAARRDKAAVPVLLELRFAGFAIEEAGSTYETVCGRICSREMRPSQMVFAGELAPQQRGIFIQTVMNLSVAIAGGLVTLPVMVLVALAVKLTSRGPILSRQSRVGQHGAPFVVYKFRTMRQDAGVDPDAIWVAKSDPRVTPAGRWLRKLRLDELPRFFNLLRGEMSLVGPKPERPEYVQILSRRIPYYDQRHCVKPGITGWAQINRKSRDTVEDTVTKLEYDLYYIKNISPTLDAYVLFRTLKTIVLQGG